MNKHKLKTFDQLDTFFDAVKKRVTERCDQLKEDYKKIEAREKRRLKNRQIKLERESHNLKDYVKEFDDFLLDFDQEMDFMANRANFDYYWQEFKQLESKMKKATNFFAVSEFKPPKFESMASEIEAVDQIGKITDNSDFSMPLVVFNTYNLKYVFNYYEKLRDFERLSLVDDENLADGEVPHYFKSIYIPDDKFLIMGGLERESSITSQRCFMVDEKGKLSVTMDMHVGR